MPSATPAAAVRGIIFNIQRFCTHDGPGIRTTVFVKGCPLHCPWCHNPEGMDRDLEIALDPRKCIGCRACLENCTRGGHEIGPDGEHLYHNERCVLCGSCAEGCYAGAIEMIGEEKTAQEVMDVVVRDKPFYDNSSGGVTLSGGEPMYQPEFSAAILTLSREQGIATAVESSCATSWNVIQSLDGLVDLWMIDIKHMDPGRHRELTGGDNGIILENVRKLATSGVGMILRLPLVPGHNDEEATLRSLGAFASEVQPSGGLEVMPFHRFGEGKYDRIRKDYTLQDMESAEDDDVRRAVELLREAGANKVHSERLPEA